MLMLIDIPHLTFSLRLALRITFQQTEDMQKLQPGSGVLPLYIPLVHILTTA